MKGRARVLLAALAGGTVLVAIVVLSRAAPPLWQPPVASPPPVAIEHPPPPIEPPPPSIEPPLVSPEPAAALGLTEELEQRLFDVTNEHRARAGLRPLDREAGLSNAARGHSEDMLRRRFFAHVNPDGQTPADRVAGIPGLAAGGVGENIWMWSGSSRPSADALVTQAVAEWMASPPHRENILRPGYTRLGVGASVDASEVYVTELFMQ